MDARLDPYAAAPEAIKAMQTLEGKVRGFALEPDLCELVRLRASQINGCVFCLHMHSRDARKAGEREDRLHLLAAWREAAIYSERERAALAWTEALTRLPDTREDVEGLADELAGLRAWFGDEEIVQLSMLVCAINAWNRIAVGFGYRPDTTW